ncbi:MAG TPA: hypothetical protein EYQ38_05250 [Candidatus Pelagibacter sp.]|jgi:hypothetical protein|nr:hypothetical protein [Candidatus Pelagibacter sp.]
MKKQTNLVIAFILLILVNGCSGYKPIFGSIDLQFKISQYSIEGNQIIGKKIYRKLNNFFEKTKDKKDVRKITLLINVSKDKKASLKNSAGKIIEYKIFLKTEIEVKDFMTNDKILNQTFSNSSSYRVQKQYSETIKLENLSIENMLEKTHQDLLIKLSQNI